MANAKDECCCDSKSRLTTSPSVINTRKKYLKNLGVEVVYRRRICKKCKGRFTTYEMDVVDIDFIK